MKLKSMVKYLTRIRLEGAARKDLEKLETELERQSFIRVKHKKGEYRRQGSKLSIIEVSGAVDKAARNTGKAYSFTIIKERSTLPS